MKSSINLILMLSFCSFLFNSNAQIIVPVKKIDELEYRLLYTRPDFRYETQVDQYIDLLDRAASVCYNGVVVQDNRFGYIDRLDPQYFENLDRFLIHAKSLGLDVFPQAATFVGHQLLVDNPNLAEGLPVKNAPFIVAQQGSEKILINDPKDTFPLLNGNFEATTNGNDFENWEINLNDMDNITRVIENGNAYVKFSNPENNNDQNLAIIQNSIEVLPYRNYHLSFKIKTENYTNTEGVGISIRNPPGGSERNLQYNNPPYWSCNDEPFNNCNAIPLDSTQNWTKYDLTFNTLENTSLLIALRSWYGGTGTLCWDDITIKPTGFNNIIRRDDESVPVVIKKGNDMLTEGVQIEAIIDPLTGNHRWRGGFTMWHQQPIIKVLNNSLQVGDELTIDYFHAGFIHNGISGPSLTHPEIFEVTQKQLFLTDSIWKNQSMFKGWFFGHDEIRLHNWENDPPNYTSGTPAENLEHNFKTIYEQAKAIDDNATIMVWNDMFDPLANGKQESQLEYPYYFVNGYWGRDSIENGPPDTGVPKDVIIVNWNYGESLRIESAKFFADNGHSQILTGYFDVNSPEDYYTDNWLRELEIADVTDIKGVMYTTWKDRINNDVNDPENGFKDVEHWAKTIWGGCPGACNDYETFGDLNESGAYGANIQLTAKGKIEATDAVQFVSPKKVKLEAGFKFSSDGSSTNIFKAYSGNCPP